MKTLCVVAAIIVAVMIVDMRRMVWAPVGKDVIRSVELEFDEHHLCQEAVENVARFGLKAECVLVMSLDDANLIEGYVAYLKRMAGWII